MNTKDDKLINGFFEWTNEEKWRHLQHFFGTHSFSLDNWDYARYWMTSFRDLMVPLKESVTTKTENPEKCSYESVSDNSNQYDNISDYVKEKALCLSDSPSETNTSDWCDTLPRKVKGDPCFPHGDDEPIC